jgi:thiamine transport system ATP-binding protein
MFQDDALFPHRDVYDNVAFGVRMQGLPPDAISARVTKLLGVVGLEGRDRRSVATLSGGERKRVALARALAPSPRVLLLDEPLGALDRALHDRLVTELSDLFHTIGQTAVYVTHDVAEAFALGTHVAVMRAGTVVQTATPEALWAAPADAWVARFLGLQNVDERGATSLVTRPEGVVLLPHPGGGAVVVSSNRDGSVVTLRARYDDGREIVSVDASLSPPPPGTRVTVEIDDRAVVEVPTSVAARG